jgi:hypothetical protein
MSTLATLVVSLTADTGKFTKDMEKAAKDSQNFSDKIGKALGTIGKVAAGVAIGGIAALGAGLAFAVKEAMEAQEVQAQLNAVLESTGGIAGVTADMANDLADKYSKITRFGDEAILSGENILLTFTNIGKDVFPQATETILNMSQALGQDLQSSATMLGKALQDPIQGVSALRRVGVNFTEDQQKLIQSLVESGDLMGAQTMILKELQVEFGGSAEAAGQTFAGQLDILKNSLSNAAESVGTALLPALTEIVSGVTPIINEYAPILADWLGKNLPVAIQTLSDFWTNTLKPAITTVWNWMSTVLVPFLVNEVYPWLQENIPKALQTLANFWSDVLKPAITTVWNWMSTVLMPFLVNEVVPFVRDTFTAAIQTLSNFWNTVLLPAITAVWDFTNTYLVPIFEAVWELFNVAGALAIAALALLWTSTLKPALDAVYTFIQDNVIPILSDLWDWFNDKIAPIIRDTVVPIFNGFKDALKGVRDAIQWVIDKIVGLVNKLKEVKLPSWVERDSPSPFEMTFLGAAEAIDRLASYSFPKLQMAMNMGAMTGAQAGGQPITNYNLTIHEAGQRGNVVMDFALMKALARG